MLDEADDITSTYDDHPPGRKIQVSVRLTHLNFGYHSTYNVLTPFAASVRDWHLI